MWPDHKWDHRGLPVLKLLALPAAAVDQPRGAGVGNRAGSSVGISSTTSDTTTVVTSTEAATSPLDEALGGMLSHPACTALWLRFLARFEGEPWLFEVGRSARVARLCRNPAHTRSLLEYHLDAATATSGCCSPLRSCAKQLRGDATPTAEARRLLQSALTSVRRIEAPTQVTVV